MAKRKRKHGCLVGCLVIFLLAAIILAVAAVGVFHAPKVDSLEKRLQKNEDLTYAIATLQGEVLDTSSLSTGAKQTYADLQSCYNQYMQQQKTPSWAQSEETALPEGGAAFAAARGVADSDAEYRFACSAVVEFEGAEQAEDNTYGLLIYTDTAATALEVYFAYHETFSANSDQASTSENYLFLRGNTVVIANFAGLKYIYLNNFI